MPIPEVRETYGGTINTVALGATAAEGGTRSKVVKVGGHTTIPFLRFEGETAPAAIALEVRDIPPDPGEWPDALRLPGLPERAEGHLRSHRLHHRPLPQSGAGRQPSDSSRWQRSSS